ncbi:polyamine aminopropyltransferase [Pandoraea terrae]|uniref:spermine/spermidine synthase domain-containing protein n=1 Tax=Pandoraea terrae TaxID=1537710 RepID=UPI001CD33CAF|nr:polyamine aminopropyltransferase [Pandoraea terrae]
MSPLSPHVTYGFTGRRVASIDTPHQRIEVIDTDALGRAYRLDGRFMASLADAHICHECMVHPLLLAHGAVQRVLILGGGDGGSAREVLRYSGVASVVVAELDAAVVAMTQRYLPSLADGAFDDPRTLLAPGDAVAYVDTAHAHGAHFDGIIFDLTEPDGIAASLHGDAFFARVKDVLAPGGAIALQLGAPWHQTAAVRRMLAALRRHFRIVRPMTAYVPLYGALWALACASDTVDPVALSSRAAAKALVQHGIGPLRHYDGARHASLFSLTADVAALLA